VEAAGNVTIGLGTAATNLSTDEQIAFWYGRTQQHPHDPISLAYLGQAYLQKGRETGDAASYGRAEAALEQALALNPDDEIALAFMASARFNQHDFQGALEMAQRVYDFDPGALAALAIIGDAHLELGHYAEAEAAYKQLLEQAASPPVYSRLARLAWLQGGTAVSLEQLQQAADEAAEMKLTGEQLAWYHAQLGEFYFNGGELTEAETQYQQAADLFPGYYLALAGLGKVRAAQGDLDEAIALYEQLTAVLPQPEFIARLGDWYALNGETAAAQKQYETVALIATLEQVNGILYNRQLALFYANHDLELETALALAEGELADRQDVYAYDTLAWALYKNGRITEAATASKQALSLNTPDAQLYYHAGLIYAAQGQTEEAISMLQTALDLNPYFDLSQAKIAVEEISTLSLKFLHTEQEN
jgi:tetratricopeptide (TPR) repeat protein